MDYELFHNDIDGSNYHFVLIEASVLQKYFDDYHQTSELNHLKGHCKSDPKQDWICFGKNLHGFIVPSIKINEEGDVTITDGRHRVLWMMSKKMPLIPVAMTHLTRINLEEKGIALNDVTIFNMPCSTNPQEKAIVSIDPEKEGKRLIDRLKKNTD
ncbi:hypothetical protein [Lelliottia amnigena]|jgi:hypothetical protein|uniref:hypothetical protein n=1 Tax=Lelliottia amnigena TaxID=61646 RepID=UPI00301A633F